MTVSHPLFNLCYFYCLIPDSYLLFCFTFKILRHMMQGNKGETDTGGVDCTTVSFSIKLQLLKSVFSGYIKKKC